MGAYRETGFVKEVKIMESQCRHANHVKVKLCGDIDESLANKIRLLIESYNNQSDKKASYTIKLTNHHRP